MVSDGSKVPFWLSIKLYHRKRTYVIKKITALTAGIKKTDVFIQEAFVLNM